MAWPDQAVLLGNSPPSNQAAEDGEGALRWASASEPEASWAPGCNSSLHLASRFLGTRDLSQ